MSERFCKNCEHWFSPAKCNLWGECERSRLNSFDPPVYGPEEPVFNTHADSYCEDLSQRTEEGGQE